MACCLGYGGGCAGGTGLSGRTVSSVIRNSEKEMQPLHLCTLPLSLAHYFTVLVFFDWNHLNHILS